jgi:hypothetical protein
MVKYAVISIYDNGDLFNDITSNKNTFDTRADAKEFMKAIMQDELNYFNIENGNNYTIDEEFIKNEYGTPIEKFMILEFYIQGE